MPTDETHRHPSVTGLVTFDYIKSSLFRVIHADGAIGGITPSGNLHIAMYSERVAIPKQQAQEVEASGQLGAPVDRLTQSRNTVVREMDVDIVMSPLVAESLAKWLLDRVADIRRGYQASAKIEGQNNELR